MANFEIAIFQLQRIAYGLACTVGKLLIHFHFISLFHELFIMLHSHSLCVRDRMWICRAQKGNSYA